jgi:N-methylhydantoinase A
MTCNFVQTYKTPLAAVDWARFDGYFRAMEAKALAGLDREAAGGVDFVRSVDFRYLGQGFEVQVEIPDGPYGGDAAAALRRLMLDEYQRVFGRLVEGVPLEVVNLRLVARARRGSRVVDFDFAAPAAGNARKGSRRVYFAEIGDYTETAVFDRLKLAPGTVLEGPAIIEEKDTTIVIPPAASARVDEFCNIIATLASVDGR